MHRRKTGALIRAERRSSVPLAAPGIRPEPTRRPRCACYGSGDRASPSRIQDDILADVTGDHRGRLGKRRRRRCRARQARPTPVCLRARRTRQLRAEEQHALARWRRWTAARQGRGRELRALANYVVGRGR
jgi:hypothetical protein